MSTEKQLGRTLHERADSIDDQPLTLDDVRGRARQIRRRQASGLAAGVALVAAVALPVALLGGGGRDGSEPSPAPSPTHAVDPFDQGVPTLQDGVIIYPDGPRIPLTLERGETADGFTPLGADQWVVTAQTGTGDRVALLTDRTGRQLATYPVSGGLVAQRADAVAWVAPDGTPQLLVAGSDEPRHLTAVEGPDPTAVAITGDCAVECEVVVRITGAAGLGPTWAVSTSGGVRQEPAAVPAVVDVSSDGSLIAGIDEYADDDIHTCGGVFDPSVGDYLWHGCDDNVFDFSPDGTLVATTFAEGLGPRGVKIRDARSGATVAEVSGDWISSYAWEDSSHLLAVVVAEDGSTSLQRIGLDGPPEIVVDGFMTSTDDLSPPIVLPVM